jgi:hypothetical protein
LGICGFLLLISLLFIIGRVWDIVFALVGVSLIVPIGLLTIDYGLRYGGVGYWISKDDIVAHDRLFRTRLWRIEAWDEGGLRVERGRLHGLLNTSTAVIECADQELWLPHLQDSDPILDVFDRRPNGVQRRE